MRSFFKKYPHWMICFVLIALVSFYWLVWASDRYVSHANVVLESPQISAPEINFSALLSGGGGANKSDMLLLRDYLLSVDMLKILVKKAGFRKHYSQGGDFFSRLNQVDVPLEELHKYYLSMVNVELDDYAGILRIDVQAFTPEEAHKIAELLISEGERHMNDMGRRLADEQVIFLEKQVRSLKKDFDKTRQALLDYQNENGLVSPAGTVESISSVVSSLESQLAMLKAKRTALSNFQSSRSSEMMRVTREIQALEEQISDEKNRLARQAGNALNSISSEYQTLQLQAKFAQESYAGALSALQSTRIEAARKLKQVSILQSPTFPQYAEKPERVYNSVVFAVVMLFATLIFNMMVMIVKDHRD